MSRPRIIQPSIADVIEARAPHYFSRRPGARHNRGRISANTGGGTTPPPAPSTPLTIISSVPVVGWWRSDLGITLGTGVSAWADQSGHGWHWTQVTGGNQPGYTASDATLNNRPTVNGDGSTMWMANTLDMPQPSVTPTTQIVIAKQKTWKNGNILLGTSLTAMVLQGFTATPRIYMYDGTNTNFNSAATLGTWVRILASYRNSTTDRLQIASSNTTGANAGDLDPGTAMLFAYGAPAFVGNFDVAEVLFTAGEPSAGELTTLDAYFSGLYGGGVLL